MKVKKNKNNQVKGSNNPINDESSRKRRRKREKEPMTKFKMFKISVVLMMFALLILESFAEKRMGLYRDLIYRSDLLRNSILSAELMLTYQAMALMLLSVTFVLYFFKKKMAGKGTFLDRVQFIDGQLFGMNCFAIYLLISMESQVDLVVLPFLVVLYMIMIGVHTAVNGVQIIKAFAKSR